MCAPVNPPVGGRIAPTIARNVKSEVDMGFATLAVVRSATGSWGWALGGAPAAALASSEEKNHVLPMVMIIMNQSVNMNHMDVKLLWIEQSLLLWSEMV
jgi:hypothetical protein